MTRDPEQESLNWLTMPLLIFVVSPRRGKWSFQKSLIVLQLPQIRIWSAFIYRVETSSKHGVERLIDSLSFLEESQDADIKTVPAVRTAGPLVTWVALIRAAPAGITFHVWRSLDLLWPVISTLTVLVQVLMHYFKNPCILHFPSLSQSPSSNRDMHLMLSCPAALFPFVCLTKDRKQIPGLCRFLRS